MSGGRFNYAQHHIGQIAEEVAELIQKNRSTKLDKDGFPQGNQFQDDTINKFQQAWVFLKQAEIYTQRIDWLVSGDDGEETFHKRLNKELDGFGPIPQQEDW